MPWPIQPSHVTSLPLATSALQSGMCILVSLLQRIILASFCAAEVDTTRLCWDVSSSIVRTRLHGASKWMFSVSLILADNAYVAGRILI